jgi:hypothetical protein
MKMSISHCEANCRHISPTGQEGPLDHTSNTRLGKSFYYCSMHRSHHCLKQVRRHLEQPPCCVCALLFFSTPDEAIWQPAEDLPMAVPPLLSHSSATDQWVAPQETVVLHRAQMGPESSVDMTGTQGYTHGEVQIPVRQDPTLSIPYDIDSFLHGVTFQKCIKHGV